MLSFRLLGPIGLIAFALLAVACGGGSPEADRLGPDEPRTDSEATSTDAAAQAVAEGARAAAGEPASETPASAEAGSAEAESAESTTGEPMQREADEDAAEASVEDAPTAKEPGQAEEGTPGTAESVSQEGADTGEADGARAGGGDGEAVAAAMEVIVQEEAEAVVMEPRRPLIVIDPGHGGDNVGAVAFGVVERESNLDFALRVEVLLLAAGYDVILTRRTAARTLDVTERSLDEVPGFLINRPDLQARIDLANEAEADLFISIHSNGATDPRASGIEVYWDGQRPHAAENERLALALHESILESLELASGYRAWDRGIREDSCWRVSPRTGECGPLFLLGPPDELERERVVFFGLDPALLGFAPGQEVLVTRATQMPAALVELLFITNEWEAGVLQDDAARQGMAIGIVRGIERYFAETAAVSEQGAAGGDDNEGEQGDATGGVAAGAG